MSFPIRSKSKNQRVFFMGDCWSFVRGGGFYLLFPPSRFLYFSLFLNLPIVFPLQKSNKIVSFIKQNIDVFLRKMTETYQIMGSLRITKSNVAKGIFYSSHYFTYGDELLSLPKSEQEVYLIKNVNALDHDSKIRNLCRLASDGKLDVGFKISEDDLKEILDKLLLKQGAEA